MNSVDSFQIEHPEIEADIYYLTELEGGRKTPVRNGYRGQFHYNGKDWDAPQQFLDKKWCQPGARVNVRLQTLSPEFHVGQITPGMSFEIREGSKTVGNGKVTKIIRNDFQYWDPELFLKRLDKRITPYSGDDLLGYKIDFDAHLEETGIIDMVEIEVTQRPECMVIVRCRLSNAKLPAYTVAETVTDCWKSKLRTSNHLYKIDLKAKFDHDVVQTGVDCFTLTFASWHSIYLTGKIIVKP